MGCDYCNSIDYDFFMILYCYIHTDINLWHYGRVNLRPITPVFVIKTRRCDKSKLIVNVCMSEYIPLNEESELVKHWLEVHNNGHSNISHLRNEATSLLQKYRDNVDFIDPRYIPPSISDSCRMESSSLYSRTTCIEDEVSRGHLSLLRYLEEREGERQKIVEKITAMVCMMMIVTDITIMGMVVMMMVVMMMMMMMMMMMVMNDVVVLIIMYINYSS